MPDDTQEVNCILEVCCGGPDSKQPKALAEMLQRKVGLSKTDARHAANFLIGAFDFAEKGTLVAFKASIAALARGNAYE